MTICAPSDPKQRGLMAYTLRYAAELRSASESFSDVKTPKINAEQIGRKAC